MTPLTLLDSGIYAPTLPTPRLVLQAAFFTTLSYITVIAFLSFVYLYNHPTYSLINVLVSSLPIGLGILLGIVVIWLVFPPSYDPGDSYNAFPKSFLVLLWHFFLGPSLCYAIAGISPFDLTQIRDIITSPTPVFSFLAIGHIFVMITYFLYFFILEFLVEHQPTNSTSLNSSQ